jgi:hypothetical protein
VLIIATPRANIIHDIALKHVFFLPGLCENEDSHATAHAGNLKGILYNIYFYKVVSNVERVLNNKNKYRNNLAMYLINARK